MSGCCKRTCSTSSGATLTPPVLIISFSRPRNRISPSVRSHRAKIAGKKPAIPVERLCIEFRRPIIAWRDVAADGELADFAFGQGLLGNEMDDADRLSG